MTKYTNKITQIAIIPDKEPIFAEGITKVSIDDEAAGEFIVISQSFENDEQKIKIDPDEWPFLKQAIDTIMDNIYHEEMPRS
jgi:hypothetical protein